MHPVLFKVKTYEEFVLKFYHISVAKSDNCSILFLITLKFLKIFSVIKGTLD